MKKNRSTRNVIFRIIFTLLGLAALVHIVSRYGIAQIVTEFKESGWAMVFLALTFIPTLVCYSISWLLATDHKKMNMSFMRKIVIFSQYTAMSISWNNLTPFLKVGGEPLKYLMLSRHLTRGDAISSTVNYNIIHLISTGLSFIIAAVILTFGYGFNAIVAYSLLAFCLVFAVFLYGIYRVMHSDFSSILKKTRSRRIKVIFINLQIGLRRLLFFYQKKPKAFVLSLFVDLFARFIEGITFYFGFLLLKNPISLLSSSLLDVGRTFIDTLFFFIPYQMGSREEGVRFFMEKILLINSSGFLTVVLFYRFVEIFWIVAGFSLWASSKSSVTEVRVKSAQLGERTFET